MTTAPDFRAVCQLTGKKAAAKFWAALDGTSPADPLVELERLREWQRKVADALGVSEPADRRAGTVWFCAEADQAARIAAEALVLIDELTASNNRLRESVNELGCLLQQQQKGPVRDGVTQ